MDVKQVLVWRSDLRNTQGHKVRSGKMAAQLAHASMKAIFDTAGIKHPDSDALVIPYPSELKEWFEDKFTKICVGVNSEVHLLELYQQALNRNLYCSIIKDLGLTEFDRPTFTAVAIGPGQAEEIDEITGHLELL